MSQHIIKKFLLSYKFCVQACAKNNITMLPYPKTVINTEQCIHKYNNELEKYVKTNLYCKENYTLQKIKIPFPREYFNYASR